MSEQQVLEAMKPGDYAIFWLKDGRILDAYIESVDVPAEQVDVLMVESGEPFKLLLDQVEGVQVDNGESEPETIEGQIKRIPIGEYLMIWGQFPGAICQTAKQGKLKSVDFAAGSLTLYSTTYNHDVWVPIDKITYIDESRSGPGALGPAQSPDWYRRPDGDWYKGDRKYEG
ncbi:hypothetical protein K4L06_04370 [Lysobacter sp. BMK333-48F3]|uniref:hypothetical protein n=1 Tax=Lysobacter sp. BMK333-48F3 TaxID=2867962 RepID=UPI001C8B833D|nr:hypothetical protein [Lysobacter sp. BMK333-48F3]MBX9400536.1 hypothetical protein [Lysobacter sp. BMK333-48F3]